MSVRIEIEARCGDARAGTLFVRGLRVPTPLFMPVGTCGTVKAMAPGEVWDDGSRVILANTFHLLQRPGLEVLERLGGLHRFMGWDGAILTDSGGYQVFSLAARREVDDDGVSFASPLDGSRVRLTPAFVVEAQGRIGSDIAMVLDVCPPAEAPAEVVEEAVRRTTRWAREAVRAPRREGQALFGIVQGALDVGLRCSHLEELAALPFDGLALGGFSVGEPPPRRAPVLAAVAPRMPADRPRYLMGLGTPGDLFDAVRAGIDMFDCVLPTRNARNGQAFTAAGRITIKQARYREDPAPLEEGCGCLACRRFSRAYVRHLYACGEILAARLLTAHNLAFYARWMSKLRAAVHAGTLDTLEGEARTATAPAT
ncbi:MAG: tRNA guanosine(34) transglycosylase Tgt [Deltaproteobacteria bacterium]|nr:tRNA guanosine(34) transglycosylase Tgt [Deltaproteobacteria bacterium]